MNLPEIVIRQILCPFPSYRRLSKSSKMVMKLRSLLLPKFKTVPRHRYSSSTLVSDDDLVNQKLEHYTKVRPTPISIAEFIERGQTKKLSEADSYLHLVHECLVRLSHMITEVKQFPKELRDEFEYKTVHHMYLDTYTTVGELRQ